MSKTRKSRGELNQETQRLTEENHKLLKKVTDLQEEICFTKEQVDEATACGIRQVKEEISTLILNFANNEVNVEDMIKQSKYEVVEENGSVYLVIAHCEKCGQAIAKKVSSRREAAIFSSVWSAVGKRPLENVVCYNCYEKHIDAMQK